MRKLIRGPEGGEKGVDPAFSAILAVTVKGREGFLLGGAYCRTGSSKMLECGIEGDGGLFNVLLQDDGRVKLVNDKGGFTVSEPGSGMEEEGAELFPIDPKDDHAAFLMSASTGGLCDADW